MELTLEEKLAKVRDLRPIDDVFFEVLAADKDVCEEMLRTILEDPRLTVEDVIVQSSERNLYGRSVRLDALCTLGDGSKVNIEVQRSDNDNHLKRARYNAASVTVKESDPGDRFEDIVELYIVYISEFDFLGEGKTAYHIDKVIRETGTVVDDGLHEIFVNTVNDDGSPTADLMSCFTRKLVQNPNFPRLSSQVHKLKETEGGAGAVCQIMQKYEEIARKQGIEYGMQQGIQQGMQQGMQQGIQQGMQQGMQQGIQQGMQQGMQQGKLDTLFALVRQGLLAEAAAANAAGMSIEEFSCKMLNS